MDGIYRKGFANICVEEDPRGEFGTYRITYFMDIEGNEITLASKKTVYNCTATQDGIDKFFKKFYANLNKGKIRLYLSPKLVDFNQPVKITANGKVLFNECLSVNPRTYLVSSADELNPEWFKDIKSVGICGATSTPKWLMEEIKLRVES